MKCKERRKLFEKTLELCVKTCDQRIFVDENSCNCLRHDDSVHLNLVKDRVLVHRESSAELPELKWLSRPSLLLWELPPHVDNGYAAGSNRKLSGIVEKVPATAKVRIPQSPVIPYFDSG